MIHPGCLITNRELLDVFYKLDLDIYLDYFGVDTRYLLPKSLTERNWDVKDIKDVIIKLLLIFQSRL